jgi:hypothetical protein
MAPIRTDTRLFSSYASTMTLAMTLDEIVSADRSAGILKKPFLLIARAPHRHLATLECRYANGVWESRRRAR